MTAKQYLQSYRWLETKYNVALEEYKGVESDYITLKSPSFDDRVQTSPINDPIGELVIRLESQKGKIALEMLACKSRMAVMRNQIAEMGDEFYMLLTLRYICCHDWKSICEKMAISRTQANRLHGIALLEFERRYGANFVKK